MASGVIHDAAFICTSSSQSLDYTLNNVRTYPSLNSRGISDTYCSTLLEPQTLRWDVQEPVGAEDEVSSEVGSGDSRSACTRSASPQPLVRASFSPRKKSILPKSYVASCQGHTTALPSRFPSVFSYQLPRFSSSHSSTPGFSSTSQKTSINSPATSSSALMPASTYAPPASISPTPISLSQSLNALRCCGKTFRRPCDLRLTSLPISLYKSPTNCGKNRRHAKIHTRPLKCPVCGAGSPDRKALDRHTVAKHPDVTPARELHHCPVPACPTQYVSARRDNCVRHIAKVHNKDGLRRRGRGWEPRTVAAVGC
jgi:ribosomal protein S26